MNEEILSFLMKHGHDISWLRGSLRNAVESRSVDYWAMDKATSFDFLQLCLDQLIPIIGGEVLCIEDGQFSFADVPWSYERHNNECFTDYLNHSLQRAKSYINMLSHGKEVFFSFTIDSDALE